MSVDRALPLLVVVVGLLGHALMWIEFINHSHATRMPRWAVWALTLFGFGALILGPLAIFAVWITNELAVAEQLLYPAAQYYALLCVLAAATLTPLAVLHRLPQKLANAELLGSTTDNLRADLGLRIEGGVMSRLMNLAPGNEVLQLEVTHKRLAIAGLPRELDGLRL